MLLEGVPLPSGPASSQCNRVSPQGFPWWLTSLWPFWIPSRSSTVPSLALPKPLGRPEVGSLVFRWKKEGSGAPSPSQWSGGVQPGRCGPAVPCRHCRPVVSTLLRSLPTRLACEGAGLTAQRLWAAGVVGQGPGHGQEARPAALQGPILGLALHRDALHRHGVLVTHAGLAVADPPLSRLQQTKSGFLRAPGPGLGLSGCIQQQVRPSSAWPGRSSASPCSHQLWSSLSDRGMMHPWVPHTSPIMGPPQSGGPPSLLLLEQGGPAGGRATHEFGKPIWSHAGWKGRRKGVTREGLWGSWPGSRGHRDMSSQPWPPLTPSQSLCLPTGSRSPWRIRRVSQSRGLDGSRPHCHWQNGVGAGPVWHMV